MFTAWQDDIFKTAMHRSCGIAYGDKTQRCKIINGDYEFVIINFDGVAIVRDELIARKFDLIIIDEANSYKNPSTRRWKTLAKIITPDTWLWLMTGTPASQSPVDAFGLARLVSPDRVPKFLGAWRDRVMTQVARFRWVPKSESSAMVFAALQPAIRFTKKECLDLPPLTYQTRDIRATPQVKSYYDKLRKQMMIEAAGETISAVNAASSLNKLLQISGGAVYTDDRKVVDFDITPRLTALREVLDETVNKVVVFVPYLHTIDRVADHLYKTGVPSQVINGNVSAKGRADIINQFQTMPYPKVLIVQPQSASHGITLTKADTIVFWSPVMSVETYIQCIGRIDRVGQVNNTTVVHLQSTPVERHVYNMLQGKIEHHQNTVDLYKQVVSEE
jgi:SNF2 family DNA or RNA helicase